MGKSGKKKEEEKETSSIKDCATVREQQRKNIVDVLNGPGKQKIKQSKLTALFCLLIVCNN